MVSLLKTKQEWMEDIQCMEPMARLVPVICRRSVIIHPLFLGVKALIVVCIIPLFHFQLSTLLFMQKTFALMC